MSRYRLPPRNVAELTANIEKRIGKIERTPQLANSTVPIDSDLSINGNLIVHGSAGQTIAEMGSGFSGAAGGSTLAFSRADGNPNSLGTLAFVILDNPDAQSQTFWLMGRGGNPLFAEDSSGNGIGVPYLQYAARPTANLSTPSVSTSSGSFAAQWTIQGSYSHPHIQCLVLVQTSDGTTGGQIRLRDSTTGGLFDTQSIPVGEFNYHYMVGDFPEPAGYAVGFKWDVEVLRNAGAGTIRTELIYAHGIGYL